MWKTTRKIEKYNKITKCQKSKSLAETWCYVACMAMGLSLADAWSHLALARSCLGLEAGQRKLKISNVYGCGVCIIYKCLLRMRTCG